MKTIADYPITPREMEVIGLLKEGYKQVEIGAKLGLSTRTIKQHIQKISRKLNIDNEKWHPSVRIIYLENLGEIESHNANISQPVTKT